MDPLNSWLISTVLFISLLVHIFASSYMAHDPCPQRFMALLLSFTGFMVILIAGDNLAVLFFGWEGIGVTSYLLIGYWFDRSLAASSAGQAIIVNRVGDTFFTIALIVLLGIWGSGSLDLHELNLTFSNINLDKDTLSIVIKYTGILLVFAAAGKSAQFLLHTWLPNAMEGYDINKYCFVFIFGLFIYNKISFIQLDNACLLSSTLLLLPKREIEIITGNLLGDGGIGYPSKNIKDTHNPRFGITLDTYSLPYLQHLFDIVYGKYSKSGIRPWPNINLPQHKDKVVTQYTFNTRSLPMFKELH